ncbi:MAG: MerR family transcriptional regulator [Alphaproteobacteria bacterium]|nr:MerR family transcriptional regulator [Alphaproteobacteria bacterium]MBV9370878.1 MerR family transcriptional regulator [Alphaproteobacteria bacterium]MBV9899668.1 MerR family transcriptional regulator [Alphaproteobacteria bacterium]
MADAPRKSDQAFRTIGELASDLGVPQHILRYWETRFPQLRPLQRAGNRRYYRPADVALAHRIHRLLSKDGYTIRGVQQLLESGARDPGEAESATDPAPAAAPARPGALPLDELRAIRRTLAEALEPSL